MLCVDCLGSSPELGNGGGQPHETSQSFSASGANYVVQGRSNVVNVHHHYYSGQYQIDVDHYSFKNRVLLCSFLQVVLNMKRNMNVWTAK